MNQHALQSVGMGLFDWVWGTSLATTLLIALVMMLQVSFGKRMPLRWAYVLWLLVAVRLVMPVVPTSEFSAWRLAKNVEWLTNIFSKDAPVKVAMDAATLPALRAPRTLAEAKAVEIARRSDDGDVPRSAGQPVRDRTTVAHPLPLWLRIVPWLWLSGAGIGLLGVLAQHRRLAAWVSRQTPLANPRLRALLDEQRKALGLRADVAIIKTTRLCSPAIFGHRHPRLLMPGALIETLQDDEMRHVLLHELVHVRRRDVLLNWLLAVVQALYWFNPLVWFALRRLRAQRELLCDAIALSYLRAEERQAYGATLIKIVHAISQPIPALTLASVIHQPSDLERRITMISQFKPTTRRATLASAALVLALTCFTFTRAAERPAPGPALAPKAQEEADAKKQVELSQRRIRALEKESAIYRSEMQKMETRIDEMKRQLRIPDSEEQSSRSAVDNPVTLHRLEAERISAHAEWQRLESLYRALTNLSRAEIRRALPTASPDASLSRLFDDSSATEQKLASMASLSPNHPDVKTLHRLQEIIHRQIDERVDGVLQGIKVRLTSEEHRVKSLELEIEKFKKSEIETSQERRPYYNLKRDLESLRLTYDRLMVRLWQEKVDAAMPTE